MRNFQKALFSLSFSVQKATYIITVGTGYSFTEWCGLCPSYLVMFHYIEILRSCRIIVNYVWSSKWESWKKGSTILREQCICFYWCPLQALYLWLCQVPSHSVCIDRTACKHQASCILKRTREWPHVIFLACDSSSFYILFYMCIENLRERFLPYQCRKSSRTRLCILILWAILEFSCFTGATCAPLLFCLLSFFKKKF